MQLLLDAFGQGFWSILGTSFLVSGSAVVIGSLVGIPLGAWLGLSTNRLMPVVRAIVHSGMALPPVVVGLMLYLLLSRSGPLSSLGWLFTPQAMIVAQIVLVIPFVVGITMHSVAAVPKELLPQLASLGASQQQVRWEVLREARGGVLFAIAAAFGRSISEVGAVMIVGGNILGHTRTMTTAIVLETSKGQFGLALALGATLLIISIALNLALLRINRSRLLYE